MSFDFKQVNTDNTLSIEPSIIFYKTLESFINEQYSSVNMTQITYDADKKELCFNIQIPGLIPISFWRDLYIILQENLELTKHCLKNITFNNPDEYNSGNNIWLCCNNFIDNFKLLVDVVSNLSHIIKMPIILVCPPSTKLSAKESKELKKVILDTFTEKFAFHNYIKFSKGYINVIADSDNVFEQNPYIKIVERTN